MQPESDAAARDAWMAVQENPRNHAAWNFLAIAAVQAGNAETAVGYAERAVALDRRNADYLAILGIALTEAGRGEDGIAALRRAVKLRPANAEMLANLGNALRKARRYEEAHDVYARACAIDPRRTDLQSRLAVNLLMQGKSGEALATLRRIQEARPDDPDNLVDLANALTDTEGNEAAIRFLQEQIVRLHGEPRLRFRLAQSLLGAGRWEEGWREYLWRPSAGRGAGTPLPPPLAADLHGTSILLAPDQGLGDMLFFLRFAADLRERGAYVLFGSPPKLLALMRRQSAVDEVVDAPPMRSLLEIALGDLPYAVQASGPRPAVRLQPRQDLVEAWQARLKSVGPAPYVGMTWRAGTDPRLNPEFGGNASDVLFKELPLDTFAQAVVAAPGTLVCVQRAPGAGEIAPLAELLKRPVYDASAANEDLEEMTALLAVLDEYVGVSNTNVHLRAGVGLGSRVLVPYPGEFRWMAEGTRSPWFPECAVYRQSVTRDWGEAMQRLRSDLLTLPGSRSPS